MRFDRALLEAIVNTHCIATNTERHELLHGGNRRSLVSVRRRIAEQAREEGYSLPQIGRALNRHHTTVINLLRTKVVRCQIRHLGQRCEMAAGHKGEHLGGLFTWRNRGSWREKRLEKDRCRES